MATPPKSINLPVTPVIPPDVGAGQIVRSAQTNQTNKCLSDLWTDIQALSAGSLPDPTTAKGDLIVRSTGLTRLPVGVNGQLLLADSADALGVRWGNIDASAVGAVPTSRKVNAGAGMSGGGNLSADITLAANVTSVFGRTGDVVLSAADIAGAGGVPASRTITAGTGLSGGGDLSADRTLAVVSDTTIQRVRVSKGGTLVSARPEINLIEGANAVINAVDNPGSNRIDVTISVTGEGGLVPVPDTRRVNAGYGLTGGGALTSDVTLAVLDEASIQKVNVHVNSVPTGAFSYLNFVAGANTSITYGSTGNRVDVTISSAAGGQNQTPWTSDIDAAGFRLLNTGNVGIGTATPGAKLDVVSGSSEAIYARQSASGGRLILGFNDLRNEAFVGAFASTWRPIALVGTDGEAVHVQNPAQDGYLFFGYDSPSNTGRIGCYNAGWRPLILNVGGGNVGIGTTAPIVKLHVAADGTALGDVMQSQIVISGSGNSGKRLYIGFDTTNNCATLFSGESGIGWRPLLLNPFGPVAIAGGSVMPACNLAVASPSCDLGSAAAGNSTASFGVGVAPTDYRIMIGYNTGGLIPYGWIQASKPGTANYPLMLNPIGSVVVFGTPANPGGLGWTPNNTCTMWLEEGTNKLWFVARKSNGAPIQGPIQLSP